MTGHPSQKKSAFLDQAEAVYIDAFIHWYAEKVANKVVSRPLRRKRSIITSLPDLPSIAPLSMPSAPWHGADRRASRSQVSDDSAESTPLPVLMPHGSTSTMLPAPSRGPKSECSDSVPSTSETVPMITPPGCYTEP